MLRLPEHCASTIYEQFFLVFSLFGSVVTDVSSGCSVLIPTIQLSVENEITTIVSKHHEPPIAQRHTDTSHKCAHSGTRL